MSEQVRNVMSPNPKTLDQKQTVAEAAKAMKAAHIGAVVVVDGATVCGIVTDRDIVVRTIAADRDPGRTTLGEICSRADLATIAPSEPVDAAIVLMGRRAIRRLPVVENGRPVGMVSIGDLALAHDRQSLLGQISGAPGNN
jgi:CBS domain-containing protein